MMKIIRKVDKSELRNFMYSKFSDEADDKKLYTALNNNQAINVFQMSAGTASQVVSQIHPDNLLEMTACNAFARPGTISGVPDYVKGKTGDLKYKNKIINSIFGETFGVCLYQEQIMQLFAAVVAEPGIGNYTRGLLKKLGKANKKQEDLDAWAELSKKFSDKAKQLGINDYELKQLLSDISQLANYSFNKSHALAYSMMAAWTLYLNVYFKKFYYPAVVEYAFSHDKETLETLKDMRRNGFSIHAPSINTSKSRTYSKGNDLFIGLHNLKQVGSAADGICERQPYNDFREFMKNNIMDTKVNKRAITALVEYGCFDELEPELTRHQMISCFNKFWDEKSSFKKISADDAERIKTDSELRERLLAALDVKIDGILNQWDNIKDIAKSNPYAIKDDKQFLKDCEAKYLGFNFFVTPFDGDVGKFIDEKIRAGKCIEDFATLRKQNDISKIVPVHISAVREYKDKNGGQMAFVSLDDRSGETISIPIFASIYQMMSDKIAPDVVALMLLYNTENTYKGGEQIMLGTKKWVSPEKYSAFVIPLRQG